ncbi:hypothetical protein MLD38_016912 [Melastoma candidum]|uniref:Uncharacterized protein n=1 Tax=Melastoma candidum TaxID=119954 RepID=A0ACB9QPI4_9MYRT|nr:hypothetical protein MLD38_016912 [Melastoma candidum]
MNVSTLCPVQLGGGGARLHSRIGCPCRPPVYDDPSLLLATPHSLPPPSSSSDSMDAVFFPDRPTIVITNDDGIDAPGLRSLVHVLLSTGLHNIQVRAPDS